MESVFEPQRHLRGTLKTSKLSTKKFHKANENIWIDTSGNPRKTAFALVCDATRKIDVVNSLRQAFGEHYFDDLIV